MFRSLGTVLGTLAVVAVALGLVVTGDSPRRLGAPASTVPLPTPRSIIRHGVSYEIVPSSPNGVAARPGSRIVTVYGMDVEQRTNPACSSLDPQVRLVSETDRAVRIEMFSYESRGHRGTVLCSYNVGKSFLAARSVRLRETLGNRALVDERSGKRLPVLDAGYVPTPAHLPAGYRQVHMSRYTPESDFEASRQYRRGDSWLYVQVSAEASWAPTGRVLGHARVDGAMARVSETVDERCVTWSARSGLVTQVCSAADGPRLLAVGELLRIARTVR